VLNVGPTALRSLSSDPALPPVKARLPRGAVSKPSTASASETPCRIQLGAEPLWATIQLDGAPVGSTPLLLREVRAGHHVIEAQALGSGPIQRRVIELAPGELEHISFHFEP